jgi:crossover junction endodeoxyribonuclease RuvC
LNQVAEDVDSLLEKFKPEIVAVEQLYSHYIHPKTAILMGHARGVILQRCAQVGVEVRSFNATRIKKSITGNGRASKQQVQKTIQTLLALPQLPEPSDVADAIAAAMCCANSLKTMTVS